MSSDLPAVIPPRPPAPGSSADLVPQPAEQDLAAPWLVWARPMILPAAHGATRALVSSWALPPDVPPTVRDVALVAVQAAADVAQDAALPAEVRGAAVRDAREIVEMVAGVSERATERRAGLLIRVLRAAGLVALGGLFLRAVEARR